MAVRNWPIVSYGASTGFAPIHVNKAAVVARVQNVVCVNG